MIESQGSVVVVQTSPIGADFTLAPYSGSLSSHRFGKAVAQQVLAGAPTEPPLPTWSSPYDPLVNNSFSYQYHGPQGADPSGSLLIPAGWWFEHKIQFSETTGLYKTQKRTTPYGRVKRTYDDRWWTDETRLLKGPEEEPPGGGGGS